MFAVSEWTNQALPPFHAGMGPTLLLASAALLTAMTLATYLLRRTLSFGRVLVLLVGSQRAVSGVVSPSS